MAASCEDNQTPDDATHWRISSGEAREEKFEDCPPVERPAPPKEPFMGNVHWYTPLPRDMSGQPIVKGMLTFDAAYENGILYSYVTIATVLFHFVRIIRKLG